MSVQRDINAHSTRFKHTYQIVCRVLNVAQASTLVLFKLVFLVLVTRRAVRIFSSLLRVNGLDNVRQHQHVLHGLALLGKLDRPHAYQFIGVIAYQFIGVIAPTRTSSLIALYLTSLPLLLFTVRNTLTHSLPFSYFRPTDFNTSHFNTSHDFLPCSLA